MFSAHLNPLVCGWVVYMLFHSSNRTFEEISSSSEVYVFLLGILFLRNVHYRTLYLCFLAGCFFTFHRLGTFSITNILLQKHNTKPSQIYSQGRLQENQDGLQGEIHQRELKVQELREAVDSHKVLL